MPKFTVSCVKKNDLLEISKDLIDKISELAGVPRNAITLELNQVLNTPIFDGEIKEPHPVVDVYWFDRPQEVQDACAEYITNKLFDLGYTHVSILFHPIPKTHWYSNGKHF